MKPLKTLQHSPMSQFTTDGDQLLVNGFALSQIADIAGQTPFYVYDRSVIRNKIDTFRRQMPNWLQLHYAVKANPMPALVQFIAPMVDGLDVASGQELQLSLNAGASASSISFAGPGKREPELKMAVAAGITINLESLTELQRVKTIAQQQNRKARVALRINPDFELKSSGMKMGGGAQQFGVDAEQAADILAELSAAEFDYQGLHIFTGSQNLRAESLIEAHNGIFELAARLQQSAPTPIKKLNIGGGLGVPYFPGERPLQLEAISENLEALHNQYQNAFKHCKIAMELGRFLVAECGLYVCRITDIKHSRDKQFVIVDGGLHHHLAASGNFGQVVRKNYPVALANKMSQANESKVQVVGPLCTPLDILANNFQLPIAELGDLFVVYQSGAYGYTASPRDFLSHPQPLQLLI